MTTLPRFIQLHSIHSYPTSLLNRDESGLPKTMVFGGIPRTRISSQCLKRTWRELLKQQERDVLLEVPRSLSSRHTFEVEIAQKLDGAEALSPSVRTALLAQVLKASLNTSFKQDLQTPHLITLGHPEIRLLRQVTQEAFEALPPELAAHQGEAALTKEQLKGLERLVKDTLQPYKTSFKAIKLGMGLESAMFGRMVTGDVLARVDSAIHVAHAFGVHAQRIDEDYYSSIDELTAHLEGQSSSAHINTSSLSSNVFYQYVVVDVPTLVSNLEGCEGSDWQQADHTVARALIARLMRIIATSVPRGKLSSMAHYGWARTVLSETGTAQPRSLANAFFRSVDPRQGPGAADDALLEELLGMDRMYGIPRGTRRHIASQSDPDARWETACLNPHTFDALIEATLSTPEDA